MRAEWRPHRMGCAAIAAVAVAFLVQLQGGTVHIIPLHMTCNVRTVG